MKRAIITIGVIATILAFGGYHFFTTPQVAQEPFLRNLLLTEKLEREPPSGSREYRSERHRFSLFYPEEMAVREFDEGVGAGTFTFENRKNAQGFQIFAVPYAEEQVSEERFRQDVPSGVRESLSNLYIDGALATSFFSRSLGLGDTFEIWFVHEGFLYEVTTLRTEEAWLSDIMKTWLFI